MRINKKVTETKKGKAFTLAEVLITLVIIGIVAAITIPSLIIKLDKVVKENQIKVFESKLQKGMDRMNLAGEVGPYYQTTEDFIKALSAHMRIVTICKAGELQNCFPYESIQVKGEDEPIKLSKITSGVNFGLNDGDYKDVAGMVLADGTPMILSWNVNCPVSDPDSSTRKASLAGDGEAVSTTACIKGIYDINGTKGPNLMLKDVLGYGGVTKLGSGFVNLAGMKIRKIIKEGDYQPMSREDICGITQYGGTCNATTQEAIDLGIKYGRIENDAWAGAVRACGGVKYLPTMDQLSELAEELYVQKSNGEKPTVAEYGHAGGLTIKSDNEVAQVLVASGIALPSGNVLYFWSSREDSGGADAREFQSGSTGTWSISRDSSCIVICLGEPNS